MNPQQLANARQARRCLKCREKDRPVARYTQCPQLILTELSSFALLRQTSEAGVGVHEMTGEFLIQRRVSGAYSQLAQLGLRLRPREVERAACAVWIVIQVRELNRSLPIFRHERGESHLGGAAGCDGHLCLQ